jgi:hypothetical protein
VCVCLGSLERQGEGRDKEKDRTVRTLYCTETGPQRIGAKPGEGGRGSSEDGGTAGTLYSAHLL